jgi:hypothetical protein
MHKSFSGHGKKTHLAASIMTPQTAKKEGCLCKKQGS